MTPLLDRSWFDGSGVVPSGFDCVSSVCCISFIASAHSVHSSETASASALDTSFRAFLKNASRSSDKFVSEFAQLLLFQILF